MASSQKLCRKNRTSTLLNKTSQLATLCGTDALIIILENDQSSQIQTHTWPQNQHEVNRILKRYQEWNNLNKHDLKRRKIDDPTVKQGFVGNTDFLGLLDSKLLLVNRRLLEFEEKKHVIEYDVQALEERCEECNPVTHWTLEYNQETEHSFPLDIVPDLLLVNSKFHEIEENKRMLEFDARTLEKTYEDFTPMTD